MKPCIGALRRQQGMTQDAVAKEVGCSRSALAGWETALHSVPVRYLWKLARCLHVTVDALYIDDDPPRTGGDPAPLPPPEAPRAASRALPPRRRGSRAPH